MLPRTVEKAIDLLKSKAPEDLDREMVESFAALRVFAHHYPSRVTCEILALLTRFSSIGVREPSRLLKQRRIALTRIVGEMDQSRIN
jgi:hypothetical protein